MPIPTYSDLWTLVTDQYVCDQKGLHGPTHWEKVLDRGLAIADITGADKDIVRLFALFHDCKRVNEYDDPGHGARGAEFARQLNGELFTLSDNQLKTLIYACTFHTDGEVSNDPTIGTCWDADRLDIGRCGIIPDSKFMFSDEAKRIADEDDFAVLATTPPDLT